MGRNIRFLGILPLLFTVIMAIGIFWSVSKKGVVYTYSAPDKEHNEGDVFQIIRKVNSFTFDMRRVHIKENNVVWKINFTGRFCSTYAPAFSPGETLTTFVYEDRSACWEIASPDYSYVFLKDENSNVVLADNCYWLADDVTAKCNGEPNFKEILWQTQ